MRNVSRLFAFTVVLLVTPLYADTQYEFRLGAERNDNIRKVTINEEEETVVFLGLFLDWQFEKTSMEAGIRSDLEYRTYQDDLFENEVVGILIADFRYKIAPDVLEWVVENNFGNAQLNPFLPDTPANRETLNVSSTGPDLRIRMGSATALEATGRWTRRNYELSDIDSSQLRGQVGLVRALNAHRRLSLNVAHENVEYDNDISNPEFENSSAYLRLESEISRGSLNVSLGMNEIERLGMTADGELIDIDFRRELTASSTLFLGYSQQFQDQAAGFVRNQQLSDVATDDAQSFGTSNPFENRLVFITWDFSRPRTTFALSYLINEEDYVAEDVLDRERDRWRIRFSRTMGSSWQFDIIASFAQTDFVGIDRQDDDTDYRVSLSRRFSEAFSIEIGFEREKRESTVPQSSYVENVTSLTFRYGR